MPLALQTSIAGLKSDYKRDFLSIVPIFYSFFEVHLPRIVSQSKFRTLMGNKSYYFAQIYVILEVSL